MSFAHILWWAACIPVALGLLLLLGSVLVVVLVVLFLFLSRLLAYDKTRTDVEAQENEAAGLETIFIGLVLILIVPAACVLLLLWSFDLAPEPFNSLGLPGYYSVGWAVRWITIAILCAGPIWATLATIAALRRADRQTLGN